ncbi:carnosine N-methyltransferase [Schistocerca cancellata]|uniref:carnosine N-methyltransferase n=1 Tax=Schistocerca cancellata TaxID=274614 RepID=UPI002117FBCC|nr:carnosine N-methyltransferase [Schistocerca cancellata]
MAEVNVSPDEEERVHFRRIVAAFKCYREMYETRLRRAETNLRKLSARHQQLLQSYKLHLRSVRECIEKNAEVLSAFVQDAYALFDNAEEFERGGRDEPPTWQDIEKLQATLKSVYRDWTVEGALERDQCYKPILEAIDNHFSTEKALRQEIKILVPGAGLGRLMFEVACRGYSCQGNEVSYFMLLSSYFLLNRCHTAHMFTIYPWVHNFANNLTCESQTRGVTFPDAVASEILSSSDLMSMAAGDFMEIYHENAYWDCVATCFFIDCSSNVVDCIEKIYSILKPGGIWVNLGPLLYHYSDATTKQPLVEPPFDIVLSIIKKFGFDVQTVRYNVESTYAHNTESLLQYKYKSIFFVCTKPVPVHQTEAHAAVEENVENAAGTSSSQSENPSCTNPTASSESHTKKRKSKPNSEETQEFSDSPTTDVQSDK